MIDVSPGSDRPEDFGDEPQPGVGGGRVPVLELDSRPPGAVIAETPYLTRELPGIGGRVKDQPEDFVVDEIPLYEPTGHGEHLYLRIQKRDVSHERMVEHLGRALNISRHDVGTAGMKDRRAITRQWVSVPARSAERLGQVETDQLHVLDACRHTNALKRGHCGGNRFTIRINGVVDDAESRAQQILEVLARFGCPNYYGPQRFGIEGNTLLVGYQLITGEKAPISIPKSRRKFLIRLGISALQSAIFNDVVADRIECGLFSEVMLGDIMTFPNSRSVFEVTDPPAEQQRHDALETLITGPMIGVKMRGPTGMPEEIERKALESRGLRVGQFHSWKSVAPGSRRPLSVRPEFHKLERDGNSLLVELTLPSGSFATVVLDELVKSSPDHEGTNHDDTNHSEPDQGPTER